MYAWNQTRGVRVLSAVLSLGLVLSACAETPEAVSSDAVVF